MSAFWFYIHLVVDLSYSYFCIYSAYIQLVTMCLVKSYSKYYSAENADENSK